MKKHSRNLAVSIAVAIVLLSIYLDGATVSASRTQTGPVVQMASGVSETMILPDLALKDIWFVDSYDVSGQTVTSGQPFDVYVTIENIGEVSVSKPFITDISLDGVYLGEVEGVGLAAGGALTLRLSSAYSSVEGDHNLSAFVDSLCQIDELDEDGQSDVEGSNNLGWTSLIIRKAEWTLAMYMDSDNNLESYGIDDYLEMAICGSSPNISIAVIMDRSPELDDRYDNWSSTKTYFVTKGSLPTENESLLDYGELNMGKADTLALFGGWAFERFSSCKRGLVIWGHGEGCIGGVCRDWTNDSDCLTMPELREAVFDMSSSIQGPVDLLGFDSCYMGNIETYYQLGDLASIVIASEGKENGDGWPYGCSEEFSDGILCHLVEDPFMTPYDLACAIVNDFSESYSDGSQGEDTSYSIAAYDCDSIIANLTNPINSLAVVMIEEIQTIRPYVLQSRNNSLAFNLGIAVQYVDVYDAARRLEEVLPSDSNALEEARVLAETVESSRIALATGVELGGSCGLSIYWPVVYLYHLPEYEMFEFSRVTIWDEFLKSLNLLSHDAVPPTTHCEIKGFTSYLPETYRSEVDITLNALDEDPGAAYSLWSLDYSSWELYYEPIRVLTEGSHCLRFHSVDYAGNKESVQEVTFSVRLDDLVTQADVFGTEGCNNWYLSPMEVSLSVVRSESTVSLTCYRLDYIEWHNYSGPFEIHDEGTQVLEFYSEDSSGNVEDIQMLEVKIDYTVPVMNILIEDGYIFNESNVQVLWICEDSCSGIDRIEYSLDEGAFIACANSTGLHLSDLGNGKHSLMIRLHDRAGNNMTEELTFEVRVASSGALSNPLTLVCSLVLISAIISSVLFLRRKRRGRLQHPFESSEGIYDSRSLTREVPEK